MGNLQRYRLNKTERLKSRKEISLLFKTGKSFSPFHFRVLWLFQQGKEAVLQTGFGVGSKGFKKAVDRNRIKRLMREAWRLQKNELAERLASRQMQLDVFIIYTGSEIPDYKMVFEKTGDILKNLIKITNENGPPGT